MPTGIGSEIMWLCPTIGGTDNVTDQSGNGNNGTYQGTGMTTVSDTGEGGTLAYSFSGSSTNRPYISFPTKVNSGLLGLSFWMSSDSTTGNRLMFMDAENSTGDNSGGIFWRQVSGNGQLFAGDPDWQVTSQNTGAMPTATWHHHVLQKESDGKVRVYSNGSLTYASPVSVSFGTDGNINAVACFGADIRSGSAAGTTMYDGLMDDLRTHDRELTSAEIAHLASSRGVLGPPGGSLFYNPFTNKRFNQNHDLRIR